MGDGYTRSYCRVFSWGWGLHLREGSWWDAADIGECIWLLFATQNYSWLTKLQARVLRRFGVAIEVKKVDKTS